jgi:MarR family transcriptional regulator, organic hydroperoxide resistance regulator
MNNINNCPVFGLYAASRKLIKVYTNELEALGLTYPQYLVISCLLYKDGASVDEIGQELFLDSGTLTPLLKRLAANGLITREHSKQDERKRVITLTPEGRNLEKSLDVLRQNIQLKFQVAPEEIQQLSQVLTKILSTDI